jgi:hypothetical protein
MNKLHIWALAFAFAFIPISQAKDTSQTSSYSQQAEPNEADLTTHKHYQNKDGKEVHSPSKSKSGQAPSGASAHCRDGSYSFSTHHSGTCSHHGGVSTSNLYSNWGTIMVEY